MLRSTFNLDLSGRTLVPAGMYRVAVECVDVRPSRTGPHPYLSWKLVIDEPPCRGQKVWFATSLSPNATWKIVRIFRSLGVYEPGMRLAFDDESKMVLSPRLAGLRGTARVEHYLWEGKERARAEDFWGPDGQ